MKTFREQFDKLVTAYLQNKVAPMDCRACFIGNLLNGDPGWAVFKDWSIHTDPEVFKMEAESISQISDGTYTPIEILRIEGAFMRVWERYGKNEESLFKAFEHALMLLRKLHESKGEVVEDYSFTKRELV